MGIFDNFKDIFSKPSAGDDGADDSFAPDNYNDTQADYEQPENSPNYYSGESQASHAYDYSTQQQSSTVHNFATGTKRKKSSYNSNGDYKPAGNIYQMNSTSSTPSVTKIIRYDITQAADAINIAEDIKAENAVIIVDVNAMDELTCIKILSFIDGVKYVYNANIELISEGLYIIIPHSVMLAGDFINLQSNDNGFLKN